MNKRNRKLQLSSRYERKALLRICFEHALLGFVFSQYSGLVCSRRISFHYNPHLLPQTTGSVGMYPFRRNGADGGN